MQLQITTDYAIRIIHYLLQHEGQLTRASELAEHLGITYQYVFKIIARLKEAGLIESEQGRWGGYKMVMDANDITLYDIIRIMEGNIYVNRCLEPDGYCSRLAASTCSVHKIFASLQNEIISLLKSKKMSDIGKLEQQLNM